MNQWDDPEAAVVANKDLYEILGIPKDASDSQIKRAYHKLAMVHHPDKRANNPEGSDDTFKQIGYAYKVLSDSEKRKIYDMGGAQALEEEEGLANINMDHLLLNILMWESGQKICFLCFLFLIVMECIVLPLLAALQLDGSLDWSWFGVTTPLWIPIGLAVPVFLLAPFVIYRQFKAAGEDKAVEMQAKASCAGCVIAGLLVGCLAGTVWMVCFKLDGGSGFSYMVAIIPILVVEGLTALSLLGMPRHLILINFLWKVLRVSFLVLLALKLDGTKIGWFFVLCPLLVWSGLSIILMLKDVIEHRRLKTKSKNKDVTLEEEASRYAPFFFALRATLALGLLISVLLLCLRMCLHWILSFTIIVIPLILSIVIAYLMICWAMLLFRPKELGEYEQFSNQDSPYGTFEEGSSYT
uniref:J domain-containing protein n=1 Tax=Guillardia theta TaxID=55529 RepID=A0A7S4NR57_GUITH|mmetsp:Transcript_30599/g.98526  ORF Transcript_30599/g.98526 Transcript_30599/m.98526 type:complete len:411 (+) Transcript_30599:120-1352(+)